MAREPKAWRQAALGGALVALGGALVGVSRRSRQALSPSSEAKDAVDAAPPRSKIPKVRTKSRPKLVPPRTRYWPPPPPKPIEGPAEGEPDARPVDPKSVKLGYERRDAKHGTVVKVMLSSAAVIVGAIAVLFYLIGTVHRNDQASGPLTQQQLAVIVPPGPRLQDHPLHDIDMQRQRENDRLTFYAWNDPQHRTARIPIARAEALVIGRPLDPLPAADAAPGGSAAPPAPASRP
jgi:hypothetical protein